jgi:hypothetical protein
MPSATTLQHNGTTVAAPSPSSADFRHLSFFRRKLHNAGHQYEDGATHLSSYVPTPTPRTDRALPCSARVQPSRALIYLVRRRVVGVGMVL